ncbi:hypothetical protein [Aeoliella mucimassa]|uniref:Uncharacterized protein n=1 Tax=Aeoliella mucimassa TaxID=2527972 RepID=A0A518ATC9_9BACT|nr:hypothetical protein [Aeoliella mucimassa]QDU57989.1 hypothetical protein Pan181_42140 [Aeoliella mucimassa]
MDFNRNQFFFLGMFVLLIGIQVRMVETYVLSPEATQFLAERSGNPTVAAAANVSGSVQASTGGSPTVTKSVNPPEWLGWCLISVGAVLVLHSLAMPKPG